MTLVATPGSSSADSYCTVAEVDAYFVSSYNRPLWADISTQDKEAILKESTRLLDGLVSWYGYKATSTQALRWPRVYVKDLDSILGSAEYMDVIVSDAHIDNTIIPRPLKDVVCELAYDILTNSGFQTQENDLTSVKVGPISINFSDRVKNQGLPQIVRNLLTGLGEYVAGSSNEARAVSLQRV